MEKYVGRIVEIIYQDRGGNLSQRRIRVESVKDDKVKAFCYTAGAPRIFTTTNILAAMPAARGAAG
ncbi:hypothetical protein [Paenibacillus sp. HJGM_3]|uniref:hypothetical protein n=1 Tax=Paenibacillus sp. HJGM_3 TaxID=3379816 RepID=UPI00385DCFAF